jgi:methylated-DNA-[protein]-cysteine S-methyltransferase
MYAITKSISFALFNTAIGVCSIAWSTRGIAGVQLPEGDEFDARRRMLRRFPRAQETIAPAEVQHAIEAIVALLNGKPRDLSAVELDMEDVPPLYRRVYEIARTIPSGATLTYGEIAARLSDRSAARDVGQALAANPFPIVVPCHRVLAAGGKLGGFSARGGVGTKRRLLTIEGALQEPLSLFDAASPMAKGLRSRKERPKDSKSTERKG